ncbi:MAG: glucose-1-phosphate thymidylyltransferase [bacterium]
MLPPKDFFDLSKFKHRPFFEEDKPVWESLKRIKPYIREVIEPNVSKIRNRGDVLLRTVVLYQDQVLDEGYELEMGDPAKGKFKVIYRGEVLVGAAVIYAGVSLFDDQIYIGEGTVIEPGALIKGPTIIGGGTEVRQGAYIRGDCLIGDRCVVGHTTEIKTGIMLDGAKAGHFAYIGDSILGNEVNLGAGTKLANLKIIASSVSLKIEGKKYDTGLRKFGAILGDRVETGCNSVTSPGTILGPRSLVYPNTTVRSGYHKPGIRIKG